MTIRVLDSLRYAVAAMLAMSGPALQAQMGVHPVILDLRPDELQRGDLEVENTSSERLYVEVAPARIDQPGTPAESRIAESDPRELGLLASPPRLIVEPGERRFVRIAALNPPGEQDRIFRVAVKPVAGEIAGEDSGLKIMVGYDTLIIQRPADPDGSLDWEDYGDRLEIRNAGNSNVQIGNGRVCDADIEDLANCSEAPAQRLYAGNTISVEKDPGQVVSYEVLFMGRSQRVVFK